MAEYATWVNYIKNADKTSIIKGNVRKIHYTFPDGNQMAEGKTFKLFLKSIVDIIVHMKCLIEKSNLLQNIAWTRELFYEECGKRSKT